MYIIKSLRRNLKTLILYSLCVGIGITAVFAVSSLADYGVVTAQDSLDSMGINGYTVTSKNFTDSAYLRLSMANDVKFASPIITVKSNLNGEALTLLGTDTTIEQMYSLKVMYGNFFTVKGILACESICVISTGLSKHFYGTENAVGRILNVTVNGVAITLSVCGVYKSDPIVNGYVPNMVDERIYVPYTTIRPLSDTPSTTIALIPYKKQSFSAVNANSRSVFGDNYTVNNIAADRAKIEGVMNTIKIILSLIGTLTLVVSAVSLMIIMVINVRESRGEIGLKKSLGATDSRVLLEVMAESVVIAFIGYLFGLIIYGIILSVSYLCGISLKVDCLVMLFSLATVLISSIISGIIPGIIAAKTSPAVTLRD